MAAKTPRPRAPRTPRPSDIEELRVELRDMGVHAGHLSDEALGKVLALTRSVGVAADALGMPRRPRWLRDIIGLG